MQFRLVLVLKDLKQSGLYVTNIDQQAFPDSVARLYTDYEAPLLTVISLQAIYLYFYLLAKEPFLSNLSQPFHPT
jgi:hypothetical protein